jgi:hypothetical protein
VLPRRHDLLARRTVLSNGQHGVQRRVLPIGIGLCGRRRGHRERIGLLPARREVLRRRVLLLVVGSVHRRRVLPEFACLREFVLCERRIVLPPHRRRPRRAVLPVGNALRWAHGMHRDDDQFLGWRCEYDLCHAADVGAVHAPLLPQQIGVLV